MNSVGLDKSAFWRILKQSRTTPGHKSLAVPNPRSTVVHTLDDVLEAWREHFATLCTPKEDENFDAAHLAYVTKSVAAYDRELDVDMFMDKPFDSNELESAIEKLHLKKAGGFDGISNEQIRYAGSKNKKINPYLL